MDIDNILSITGKSGFLDVQRVDGLQLIEQTEQWTKYIVQKME